MSDRTLEELRKEIDEIDHQIVDAFRHRMALSAEIAEYKKENGLPILDVDREKAKLEAIAKSEDDDMSAFASKLYLTLADLSKDYQQKVLEENV